MIEPQSSPPAIDENIIGRFLDDARRLEAAVETIVIGQPEVVRETITALLAGGLTVLTMPAMAQSSKPASKPEAAKPGVEKSEKEIPTMSLLEAARKRLVSVEAEGMGDGRMALTVTAIAD